MKGSWGKWMLTRAALAAVALTTFAGCFDFDGALDDCVDAGICGDEAAPEFAAAAALTDGYVGEAYAAPLTVAHGTLPLAWAVTSGALPDGVTLDGATGALEGTATSAVEAAFTVTVTDKIGRTAARAFNLRVYPPPSITTASLVDAYASQPYSAQVAVAGGKAPYTYSVSAGELPGGLSLTAGATAGTLAGTATASGAANFTVTARDANGRTATQALSLTVYVLPSLSLQPLADAYLGTDYTRAIAASGGKAPLTLEITNGEAPAGLSFSGSGVFSGAPTSTGPHSFTVTVTDANARSQSQTYSIAAYAPPQLTTPSLSDAYVNVAYSGSVSATGGKGPLTYSVSEGTLPVGLSLSSGGSLNGSPTSGGSRTFTVQVADANGVTSSVQYSLATYLLPTLPSKTLADGYLGSAFSDSVVASNGKAPFGYEITSGNLPTGVAFSAEGLFSGTPTATAAPSTISITATDSNGRTAVRDYLIAAYVEPTITTSSPLADLYTGAALSGVSVASTGGKGTHAFTVSEGALPTGVTLTSGGALTGTPTTPGAYSFTVRATDANGHTATQPLSVTVYAPPAITSASALPDGVRNVAYSETITFTGGKTPYTWSISGALPPGITQTGPVIAGTPTVVRDAAFTLTLEDANGRTHTRSMTLSIYDGMTITTGATLTPAYTAFEYSQQLNVTGGKPSHDWALSTTSTLPPALTMSSSGLISGTPEGPITGHVFGVVVTDANGNTATKSFALTVHPRPSITTTTLPDAYVGNVYLASVQVTGGRSPYTYDKASGTFPSGITAAANDLSGTAGTPTGPTPFVSSFSMRVTDANGLQATQPLTITTYSVPDITTAALGDAYQGTPFTQTLAVSGGKAAFTWSVASGELPDGLALSADGVLSGTATTPGSHSFSIKVRDLNGKEATRGFTQTVQVPLVLSATFPDGYVGRAYSAVALAATGGRAPYTFALASGSTLPAGLTLASGVVSGTPTAATAGASFTLQVTDANGTVDTGLFTVAVFTPPSVVTLALADAYSGTAYSAALAGQNGKGAYTWALAGGALPTGISLASDGTLSGTTTQTGAHAFTVELSDENGITATGSLSLVVRSPLQISTTTLGEGYAQVAYSASVTAAGGASPYTFTLASGTLPAGVTLAADGTLSGTPDAAGTFSFTVQVSDGNSVTATAELAIVVRNRPRITTAAVLVDGYEQSAYVATLAAADGKSPYSYSVPEAQLPPGITLSSGGAFSGTPSASGSYTFTVTVTDANGQTGTAELTVEVHERLEITTAALPDGYVSREYTSGLTASGGPAGGYTWAASGLPGGLALDTTTGSLSGFPEGVATATVVITVTDSNGVTASRTLTLTTYEVAEFVTTSPLADGYLGSSYPVVFSAAKGKAPYTYVATSLLPDGLTLEADGTVSGTLTGYGLGVVGIRVSDVNGVGVEMDFALPVLAALEIQAPAFSDLYTDTPVTETFSASGGKSPYSWSLPAGNSPPAGMTFLDGVLDGTSTGAGTHAFTVRVTDANLKTANQGVTLQTYVPPAITTAALPNAFVGAQYSQTLTSAGGKASLSWSATGLPAFLSLDPATGALTGTPAAADLGTHGFDVTLTDANGRTHTQTFNLQVLSGFFITTSSLSDAYLTVAYSKALEATGGTPPYTWAASGLPAGITLSGATLSGTPTVAGTFPVILTATDDNGVSESVTLNLVVYARPAVNTAALADGYITETYGQTLTGRDGKTPYSWGIAGTLPPGTSFTAASGVISGVPTAAGSYPLTLTVTDANGQSASAPLTLTTYALPFHSPPEPTAAYRERAYSFAQQAGGGKGPLTWFVDGTLPAGLTLAPATGVISGTPTVAATSATFASRVRDLNGKEAVVAARTLTVLSPPQHTTAAFARGYVNAAYSQALTATGGASPYSYSIPAPELPPGLTLQQVSGVWQLAGTPTTSGTFAFNLTVTDGNGQTAVSGYSVIIDPALNITTTTLAATYSGDASYPGAVAATGGRTPYRFSLQSGALPASLVLNEDGTFSGAVTAAAGSSTFFVQVQDANTTTDVQALTLQVLAPPAITGTFVPEAYVNGAYSVTHGVTGGAPAYSWSISGGALPPGVTLDLQSGTLSGSPTTAGLFNFTLTVSDGNGRTDSRPYALRVHPPLQLPSLAMADGYAGSLYPATFTASGGEGPYSYFITAGSLPPGLVLRSTGVVENPINATAAHDVAHTFTVTAQDSNGQTTSTAFTIQVYRAPLVINGTLAVAFEGVDYRVSSSGAREQIRSQFGKPALNYAAFGLPPGLSVISSTGEIVGIPAPNTQGVHTVTLNVGDANGRVGGRTLTMSVQRPKAITGGGTASAAPGSSPITDVLTVFTLNHRGGIAPDVAIRVRKNGFEYSPVKEAVTGVDGRVVFTGLGLNGTSDTVDLTASGMGYSNLTLAGINAALVTLVMEPHGIPGRRAGAVHAFDASAGDWYVYGGQAGRAAPSLYSGDPDSASVCVNDTVRMRSSSTSAAVSWFEAHPAGLTEAPVRRNNTALAAAISGSAVLFGGSDCSSGASLGDTWLYNAATQSWVQVLPPTGAPWPAPRQGHRMARSGDGRVWMFGGRDANYNLLNELWMFNPNTQLWTQVSGGLGPSARVDHAMSTGPGGVWVCGGSTASGTAADCWSWDVGTNSWIAQASLPDPRMQHEMAFSGGAVWAYGGLDGSWQASGDLLKLAGGFWSVAAAGSAAGAPAARVRSMFTYDPIRSRLVLYGGQVSGGGGGSGGGSGLSDEVWFYPASGAGTWVRGDSGTTGTGAVIRVSGTISGGAPSSSSHVRVTLSTESGQVRETFVSLSSGSGSYQFDGLPSGERMRITALNEDYSVSPSVLANFLSEDLGQISANTTRNLLFPGTRPPLVTASGTFSAPGWPSSHGFFLRPFSAMTGFSSFAHQSGSTFVDYSLKTFQLTALQPAGLETTAQIEASASAADACLRLRLSRRNVGGALGEVVLPNGPADAAPGLVECALNGLGIVNSGTLSSITNAWEVRSADLNGDGLMDLVSSGRGQDNFLWVALNSGGWFSSWTALQTLPGMLNLGVEVGDLDGDGNQDLVVVDASSTGSVAILYGVGDGTFESALEVAQVADSLEDVVLIDFNTDGRTDIAFNSLYSARLFVMPADVTARKFDKTVEFPFSAEVYSMKAVDLTGDGIEEIAAVSFASGELHVYGSLGNGIFFGPDVYSTRNNPFTLDAADFDGDGSTDLVVSSYSGMGVEVFLNDGSGVLGRPDDYPLPDLGGGVAAGDFTGDGQADFLVASGNRLLLFGGNSKGGFTELQNSWGVSGARMMAKADLNSDGTLDIVVAGQDFGEVKYGLVGRLPPEVSASTPITFTAPANTRIMKVVQGATQMSVDWTFLSPVSGPAVSVQYPQVSTLRPARSLPVNQRASWTADVVIHGTPLDVNNLRFRGLEPDTMISLGARHFVRQ